MGRIHEFNRMCFLFLPKPSRCLIGQKKLVSVPSRDSLQLSFIPLPGLPSCFLSLFLRSGRERILVGYWRGNGWNGRHCVSLVPWQDRNSKIKTRGSILSNTATCTRAAVVSGLCLGRERAEAHRKGQLQ